MQLHCGWSPTPDEAVDAALSLAVVGPGDVLIDLGSGDGRVLRAARKRGAVAHGIDADPKWAGEGVTQADMFEADLGCYNVAYCYLHPENLVKLRDGAFLTLLHGARIVTYRWEVPHRQPWAQMRIGLESVFLYKVS